MTRTKVSLLAILILALALFIVACQGTDVLPAPDSDSDQAYKDGSELPVDDNVYELRVQIIGDVKSLTRTSYNYSSSFGGAQYGGVYGSISGGASASTTTTGKGHVRALILNIEPYTSYARVNKAVILKTTDTKLIATLIGDEPTVKCRLQAEALAAVRDNETFDPDTEVTWELDFCRMASPEIFTLDVDDGK